VTVTASWFGNAGTHLAKGEVAFLTDTIRVALMKPSFVFNVDTQDHFGHVVAEEIAVTSGYTARGVALGSKTVAYDAATNRTRLKAANSVWTPSAGQSLAAAGAVIYKDAGSANNATSWLLGYVNFGATITAIGAPLTINWDTTDGLLYLETA
jgi:hypothetical protein